MRGVVTFRGSSVTAVALLKVMGCKILDASERQDSAVLEIEAEGEAASFVALAVCDGLLTFYPGEEAPRKASGFHPVLMLA